jgi:hypothetical protein
MSVMSKVLTAFYTQITVGFRLTMPQPQRQRDGGARETGET